MKIKHGLLLCYFGITVIIKQRMREIIFHFGISIAYFIKISLAKYGVLYGFHSQKRVKFFHPLMIYSSPFATKSLMTFLSCLPTEVLGIWGVNLSRLGMPYLGIMPRSKACSARAKMS